MISDCYQPKKVQIKERRCETCRYWLYQPVERIHVCSCKKSGAIGDWTNEYDVCHEWEAGVK